MPLFPPGTPVTVLVDGRPLAAYTRAYLIGNRVYAAVSPLLTRLADRLWVDGDVLVVERDGRRVRTLLQGGYVRAGVVLRGLGVPAHYEPAGHRLIVTTPLPAPVASPTPFNSAVPRVAPSAVFTPWNRQRHARSGPGRPCRDVPPCPFPRRTVKACAPTLPGMLLAMGAATPHSGTRALTTGTIQTAYALGLRTLAII